MNTRFAFWSERRRLCAASANARRALVAGVAAGIVLVGCVGHTTGSTTAPATQAERVTSFESSADLGSATFSHARGSLTREHATDGVQALEIEFLPAAWSSVRFTAAAPWDWRRYGGLALDVTVPGPKPVRLAVRLDDDAEANGKEHSRTGATTVDAGASVTILVPLSQSPQSIGMQAPPVPRGMTTLPTSASAPLDVSHVVAYWLTVQDPPEPVRLVVDNVRLVPQAPLERIVDEFGQFSGADWPGKLVRAGDLAGRRAAEEADLAARAHPAGLDRYGGWLNGPAQAATGFFRTAKVDGRWWLVTPEGHLFLSLGMNAVMPTSPTAVEGRESMFAWLPPKQDPLARHLSKVRVGGAGSTSEELAFDFYAANLERKYGREYERPWAATALDRLSAWGINTVGNWSDRSLYRNGRVPYVASLVVPTRHARVGQGASAKMHDPYDPLFARDVAEGLQAVATVVKGDPWCLGYFVHNELSWGSMRHAGRHYNLALAVLASDAEQPARQALIAQLKASYSSVDRLNAAWGTEFGDWNALAAPPGARTGLKPAVERDLSAFLLSFARQYFRVVRDEVKRADPDHLYLGCRFAQYTPEAVQAAAEIVDVVSFNVYAPKVDPEVLRLAGTHDRPCMVSEFHFGALDRGMFGAGLVAAPSQKARGDMFVDYVRSALDHPAFVGCHWFKYVDEPLTGRIPDGENHNIGFVSVVDSPYPEMATAAQRVQAAMYTWHASSARAASR